MHKIFLFAAFVGFGVLLLARGPQGTHTERRRVLLGQSEQFVQSVPGEPTNEWVFRCNRLWQKRDTLFMFEYDQFQNTTRRSSFVGNEIVAVDLFYWQTSYQHGAPESKAFKVPVSRHNR